MPNTTPAAAVQIVARVLDESADMRADVPHVGLFNQYEDAQEQARFRADITGYRYRVRFERANRWWQITETTRKLSRERTY